MKVGRIEFPEIIVGLPPDGWTMGHVTVKTDERPPFIVECWAHGAFAVHPLEIESGSPRKRLARLSHKPTGLNIGTFETLDLATEAAELIEPLTNWNAIKARLTDPDLSKKVTGLWQAKYDHYKPSFDQLWLPFYRPSSLSGDERNG
jgi:hypothetical protein